MDRDAFIRELMQCLKENDNKVSEKETAEGWCVLHYLILYSCESLTYSFPQIKEKGAIALRDKTTEFLLQEKDAYGTKHIPTYMLISSDVIKGIEYCIDK